MNLAAVRLNFSVVTPGGAVASTEFADTVSSFVVLGGNAVPGGVGNAVDGDFDTHTTMGNTAGLPDSERLRVTVGFASSVTETPVPAALGLIGSGIFGSTLMWQRTA